MYTAPNGGAPLMAQQVAAMNNVAPNPPSIAPSTQNAIRPLPYQNNTKQPPPSNIPQPPLYPTYYMQPSLQLPTSLLAHQQQVLQIQQQYSSLLHQQRQQQQQHQHHQHQQHTMYQNNPRNINLNYPKLPANNFNTGSLVPYQNHTYRTTDEEFLSKITASPEIKIYLSKEVRFFGAYWRNTSKNLCGFPTAGGLDYMTWLNQNPGKTPPRTRDVIVDFEFPHRLNYGSVLFVGCLHALRNLPSDDSRLLGQTVSAMDASEKIGKNSFLVPVNLNKMINTSSSSSSSSHGNSYSLSRLRGTKAFKTSKGIHGEGFSSTDGTTCKVTGIFKPRTWTFEGDMGSLRERHKLEMLHRPVVNLNEATVDINYLALFRVLVCVRNSTSSSMSNTVFNPEQHTIIACIRSPGFVLGSSRSLRRKGTKGGKVPTSLGEKIQTAALCAPPQRKPPMVQSYIQQPALLTTNVGIPASSSSSSSSSLLSSSLLPASSLSSASLSVATAPFSTTTSSSSSSSSSSSIATSDLKTSTKRKRTEEVSEVEKMLLDTLGKKNSIDLPTKKIRRQQAGDVSTGTSVSNAAPNTTGPVVPTQVPSNVPPKVPPPNVTAKKIPPTFKTPAHRDAAMLLSMMQ